MCAGGEGVVGVVAHSTGRVVRPRATASAPAQVDFRQRFPLGSNPVS